MFEEIYIQLARCPCRNSRSYKNFLYVNSLEALKCISKISICLISARPSSSDLFVYEEDSILVIRDKFPKAKVHLLLIARDPTLDSLIDLSSEHIPLLVRIYNIAQMQIEIFRKSDPSLSGYAIIFGKKCISGFILNYIMISSFLTMNEYKTKFC